MKMTYFCMYVVFAPLEVLFSMESEAINEVIGCIRNVFIEIRMIVLKSPPRNGEQSGAVEACWAHNPEVRGSKPRSAKILFFRTEIYF